MNKIVLKPIGGLCNRVRAIDSVLSIARASNKRLVVIWERNRLLNCSYMDLFLRPTEFDLVETSSVAGFSVPFFPLRRPANPVLRRLYKLTESRYALNSSFFADVLARQLDVLRPVAPEKYADCTEFDRFSYEIFSDTVAALKDNNDSNYISTCWRMVGDPRYSENFLPAAHIVEQADKVAQQFAGNTYGLHIRGTDAQTAKRYSNVGAFESQIQTIITTDPDASFFLASDEAAIKSRLLEKYRKRMFSFEQTGYARNSAKNIQNALIDLLCLARTREVYGSYFSTFSQVAADWGEIGHTTVLASDS